MFHKKYNFGAPDILKGKFLLLFNLELPEFEHSIVISKCVFIQNFKHFHLQLEAKMPYWYMPMQASCTLD